MNKNKVNYQFKYRRYNKEKKIIIESNDLKGIKSWLNASGILYEQWKPKGTLLGEMENETEDLIKKAYATDINRLIAIGGYQTCDVVSLTPENENKTAMREKFLTEHTHNEDEVRFFVRGSGLFSMNCENHLHVIYCEAGDLISVPAKTPHWFDMGANPDFTCIRLFNNPEGWVAHYTHSKTEVGMPLLMN